MVKIAFAKISDRQKVILIIAGTVFIQLTMKFDLECINVCTIAVMKESNMK
jgi:hypothetical protein